MSAEMQQVMGELVDEGQVPWWWVFVVLTRKDGEEEVRVQDTWYELI